MREHRSFENPRATDPTVVPEDIQLKASEFLCRELKFEPMVNINAPSMAKVTSFPWPEVDKIRRSADWCKKTSEFFVRRIHDNVLRGEWVFRRGTRNEWRCVRGGPLYMREHRSFENPRATDPSTIPDDIQLKATEFLCRELEFKPMVSKRKS
jgi:hypothetical protein